MSREFSRRAALALTGAFALAACGKQAGAPAGGGTLRYGTVAAGGATAVTDPHGTLFNESDWVRMAALYDVLCVPGENGAVAPRLATAWSSSPDATRWRFELRTDAVFTDGRPVRARDVLYSLRRIASKAAANGARLGTVDIGRSTADGNVLELVTSLPDAELPRTLAGVTFVVPEGTETFDNPVGSGPFKLARADAQGIALVRNDGWWGPRPPLDGLEIRGFADPQALSVAVVSGVIDVAANVSPATAKAAERTGRLAVTSRPAALTYPLLMRLDKAPFDQPRVRQAVKLAVDRQALVDTVLLGYGAVGNDAPGPADPSYPRDLAAPARDVAKARALAGGVSVVLHTTTAYPGMVSTATAVAGQLREAGITVEVRQHPPETYWTQVYTVEPFCVGYTTDLPFPVWARQTALSTAGYNETGWKDPATDRDFATAMATTDPARRAGLLRGIQQRMAAEGGWVVWGSGASLTVAAPPVRNLPSGTGFARIFLDGVWLQG
ncbi:ABC transporter substrate-binding protein [Amycolatopsis tolypomycina]|uniref:Peptide/nickel transport system substrate-binding protein n=1 Tax=Amycolatopsis tolypomycina TaxID=208445 RepID=A0A1H4T1W5_9PSEU|nr:ABC transporter substrate-binding protein [Amycolatopsis tolypomycina]SEC50473.1 peptide/nickel transport system substrate-binding protein [Amycolatopsis tolypomycina]